MRARATIQVTQGRMLIEALKRRPMTYLEMILLARSCSPWRRVSESLAENEKLIKTKRGDLIQWSVKTVSLGK
jgi:hypothetical protein